MIAAIISDIHANYQALLSVAPLIASADVVYSLGDIVGYGPQPNECCRFVEDHSILSVSGNHDLAALGLCDTDRFNPRAKAAIEWTEKALDGRSRRFLKSLDRYIITDKAAFMHGSWRHPDAYVRDASDAFSLMRDIPVTAGFIGHTHRPALYMMGDGEKTAALNFDVGVAWKMEYGYAYSINVGSVGQPRDKDPRASVVFFDDEKMTITIMRQNYDIAATQNLMRDVGLPEALTERLSTGL